MVKKLIRSQQQGWQMVRLEDKAYFSDILSGGTPKTSNTEYFGGKIPWVRLRDMNSMYVSKTEESLSELGLRNSNAKLIPRGAVIVSTRATIGDVAIAGTELCTNQGFKSIVCNTEMVMPEFLYYYIRTIKTVLKSLCKSTTYAEINKSALEKIVIPIPEIGIQESIVNRLNKIVPRIENNISQILEIKKLQIEKIKRLLLDTLGHAFAKIINNEKTERITLGDIIREIKFGTNQKCVVNGSGIPVLRMQNIRDGAIDYSLLKYATFTPDEEQRYLLRKSDILINRTNSPALVGKSAVFDRDAKFAFASYIIRIRADTTLVDPYFLSSYINSQLGRQYIESVYIKTAGQANINSQHLKAMPIMLPPLSRQGVLMAKYASLTSEFQKNREDFDSILKSYSPIKSKLDDFLTSVIKQFFVVK